MTGMPGLPITVSATYHHLKCFLALLMYGASPDLGIYKHLGLPDTVYNTAAHAVSVPHAIIRYRLVVQLEMAITRYFIVTNSSTRTFIIEKCVLESETFSNSQKYALYLENQNNIKPLFVWA